MNILQAKTEIKNSVTAYLAKNSFGEYEIQPVHQRPILLIGPPGIGKTAIMAQIAGECHIGLVAYTITHHTRQSAIGLPYIVEKTYNGKETSVTEYTMSEIIGAVYEEIEKTGLKEGILFIDEINCVSETLAPMMLQFLQNKTFGQHKVPAGWIIVAAGNPAEYNKSVKDFDIVTLDRVRQIVITEDFGVWKEYGYSRKIHGSIMTYLEIKKENFYVIETTVDGKRFATARGWEDLSAMLRTCEKLSIPVEESMIIQYIQHPAIAKDFANYYDLYCKYDVKYNIEDILQGNIDEKAVKQLRNAEFDERVSVIGLIISRLNENFSKSNETESMVEMVFDTLKQFKEVLLGGEDQRNPGQIMQQIYTDSLNEYNTLKDSYQLDKEEQNSWQLYIQKLEEYHSLLSEKSFNSNDEAFNCIKEAFDQLVKISREIIDMTGTMVDNGFTFLEKVFGESQEMVIFLTELNSNSHSVKFIKNNGNDMYFKYNKSLIFGQQKNAILNDIKDLV